MSVLRSRRFLGFLVAGLAACAAEPEPLPIPERIVLVSLDMVRADALAEPVPE